MKALFKNEAHNEQFNNDGFVVIPFVTSFQLELLTRLFKETCPTANHEGSQLYYSLFNHSLEENIFIRNSIKAILDESYGRVFSGYRSFAESFLAKSKTEEDLQLHQDWNYSDETLNFAATIWCPLTSTTISNGTLFMLPGSHRYFNNFRSATYPASRFTKDDELWKKVRPVEIKQGEAIVFHQALFHGSYPNTTNDLRVVAASIILEAGQPAYYYHRKTETEAVKYAITDDRFMEILPSLATGAEVEIGEKKENIRYSHQAISLEDLKIMVQKEQHAYENQL